MPPGFDQSHYRWVVVVLKGRERDGYMSRGLKLECGAQVSVFHHCDGCYDRERGYHWHQYIVGGVAPGGKFWPAEMADGEAPQGQERDGVSGGPGI